MMVRKKKVKTKSHFRRGLLFMSVRYSLAKVLNKHWKVFFEFNCLPSVVSMLWWWGGTESQFVVQQWHPTPVLLPGKSHDGGAWWAALYGVAQSRTQLKWFSSSSSTVNGEGRRIKNNDKCRITLTVKRRKLCWEKIQEKNLNNEIELSVCLCSQRKETEKWKIHNERGIIDI